MQQPSCSATDSGERRRLDAVDCEEAEAGGRSRQPPPHRIDPDPSSVSSDYSELGEPIREHLAGVQIVGRCDLELASTTAAAAAADVEDQQEGPTSTSHDGHHHHQLSRQDNETDEQFARRVRKTNYLSLAQVRLQSKPYDSAGCSISRWGMRPNLTRHISVTIGRF